jgi:hypothetical protein
MTKKNIFITIGAAFFSLGLIFISSHDPSLSSSLSPLPFIHPDKAFAQSTGSQILSGYAWSSNVGWIHLQGTTTAGVAYGVTVSSSGALSGYGYSSNVGWLSFNPNSCGAAPTYSNGTFSGYADFISAPQDEWNGCVHLSGTATNGTSTYGITGTSALTGYAWGSNVVGWIDFSRVILSGSTSSTTGTSTPPTICTPGTQTCSGGLVCSTSGTCPQLCPDGTPLPASGDCTVNSAQNKFTATGQCSSVSASNVSLVLSVPNAENGSYSITKNGSRFASGVLDSGGHGNSVDTTTSFGTTYTYVATIQNNDKTQTITLPYRGNISATTPTAAMCQAQYASAGQLTASPALIQTGGTCTLAWTGVNAADSASYTCSLVNVTNSTTVSGVSSDSGSAAAQPTSSTRYQIQCSGSGSTVTSNTATCSVGDYHEF